MNYENMTIEELQQLIVTIKQTPEVHYVGQFANRNVAQGGWKPHWKRIAEIEAVIAQKQQQQ